MCRRRGHRRTPCHRPRSRSGPGAPISPGVPSLRATATEVAYWSERVTRSVLMPSASSPATTVGPTPSESLSAPISTARETPVRCKKSAASARSSPGGVASTGAPSDPASGAATTASVQLCPETMTTLSRRPSASAATSLRDEQRCCVAIGTPVPRDVHVIEPCRSRCGGGRHDETADADEQHHEYAQGPSHRQTVGPKPSPCVRGAWAAENRSSGDRGRRYPRRRAGAPGPAGQRPDNG